MVVFLYVDSMIGFKTTRWWNLKNQTWFHIDFPPFHGDFFNQTWFPRSIFSSVVPQRPCWHGRWSGVAQGLVAGGGSGPGASEGAKAAKSGDREKFPKLMRIRHFQ